MEYLIPRLLCAFLGGVILSQTGSFIQLSTRNVLAAPSTLGFDGMSILWVLIFHSLTTTLGLELGPLALILSGIPIFIFFGFYFSRYMASQKSIEKIILVGLTFNLLVGAVFSLWQFFFLAFNLPFPAELWFGHFRFADLEAFTILISVEALIIWGWVYLKNDFRLFSLGKNISRNLHIRQQALYHFLFISVAIGTFVVVGLFGAFSFLALIFPYVARKFWFQRFDLEGELFLGAILNGVFLMLIDGLSYFFPIMGAEVPVGLVATTVGAVSLIFLLWKSTLAKPSKKS